MNGGRGEWRREEKRRKGMGRSSVKDTSLCKCMVLLPGKQVCTFVDFVDDTVHHTHILYTASSGC